MAMCLTVLHRRNARHSLVLGRLQFGARYKSLCSMGSPSFLTARCLAVPPARMLPGGGVFDRSPRAERQRVGTAGQILGPPSKSISIQKMQTKTPHRQESSCTVRMEDSIGILLTRSSNQLAQHDPLPNQWVPCLKNIQTHLVWCVWMFFISTLLPGSLLEGSMP